MIPPVLRTALNYGAGIGISCFVVFLLIYFAGFNPLGNASWLGAWIPVVFICLSTRHFREQETEGFIGYGNAFRIGLLTAMAGALLFALIIYLFGTLIDSNLVTLYKNDVVEQLEQTKAFLGDSLYEKMMENVNQTTMFSISSGDFFTKCIGGLIVSLITAAVYKKDPPVFKENA
jgi:hypothetical protein